VQDFHSIIVALITRIHCLDRFWKRLPIMFDEPNNSGTVETPSAIQTTRPHALYPLSKSMQYGGNVHIASGTPSGVISAIKAYVSATVALTNKKWLVVFDIDDTVIDENGGAMKDGLELAKWASQQSKTLTVIAITARSVGGIKTTAAQLSNQGMACIFEEVIHKPLGVSEKSMCEWKHVARRRAEQRHGEVLFTVGDRACDHDHSCDMTKSDTLCNLEQYGKRVKDPAGWAILSKSDKVLLPPLGVVVGWNAHIPLTI
jgi:hypothetical protein